MTNNSDNGYFSNIDLSQIFKALWSKIWAIIIAAVIGGALFFSYAKFMVTPMYSSSIKLYVNNNTISLTGMKETFSATEIGAAQKLVNTYIVILNTYETMEGVIEKSGIQYAPGQLMGMVSASAVNETEIFQVNVRSSDPEEAAIVANAFADVLPEQIAEVIEGSSVKVVSRARVNRVRVSPSYTSYLITGAALGIVLACVFIVAYQLFDDVIHDEEYITSTYKYPVLAGIPSLNDRSESSKSKYYSYSSYSYSKYRKSYDYSKVKAEKMKSAQNTEQKTEQQNKGDNK